MQNIAALAMSDYIYLSRAKAALSSRYLARPGWYDINFSVSRLLGWQQGWAGLGWAGLGWAGHAWLAPVGCVWCAVVSCDGVTTACRCLNGAGNL